MRKIFFDVPEKLCSHLLGVNELTHSVYTRVGFSGGSVVKNPPANAEDIRYMHSIPGSGRPWSREWQCISAFLPGESHAQRSLADYSPQGRKESAMTEVTQHTHIYTRILSPPPFFIKTIFFMLKNSLRLFSSVK